MNRYQSMSNPPRRQPLHLLYPGRYMQNDYYYTGENILNEDPIGLYKTKEINDNLQMAANYETESISRRLGGRYPIISHPAVEPEAIIEDPRLIGLNLEGNSGISPNFRYDNDGDRYNQNQTQFRNNYNDRIYNDRECGYNEYTNLLTYQNTSSNVNNNYDVLPKYNWNQRAEEIGYNKFPTLKQNNSINIREYDKNNQKKSSLRENYTNYRMNYDTSSDSDNYIHTHPHTHTEQVDPKKYYSNPVMATSRSSKVPRREIPDYDLENRQRNYQHKPVGGSSSSSTTTINAKTCSTDSSGVTTCIHTVCKDDSCNQYTCNPDKKSCSNITCKWTDKTTICDFTDGDSDTCVLPYDEVCLSPAEKVAADKVEADKAEETAASEETNYFWLWMIIGAVILAIIFIFIIYYFNFRDEPSKGSGSGGAYNGIAEPGFTIDPSIQPQQIIDNSYTSQQPLHYATIQRSNIDDSNMQYADQQILPNDSSQCVNSPPPLSSLIQNSNDIIMPTQQHQPSLNIQKTPSQPISNNQQQPYQVLNFYNGINPSM